MAPNEWKCGVVDDDEDDKYKLNEEISYGISLRKSRNQEKQILLAQDQYSEHSSVKEKIPPFSRPAKRAKRKTTRKTKKSKDAGFILMPPEDTEKRVLDRFSCTRKEYIDILSAPKREHFMEEPKKKQAVLHPASPRFAQLALPTKKLAYNTWLSYHKFLRPEQIISLQNYLTKEEALDPKDARDYFKRLDKKKKAENKLKKKKEREKELVKKPQKSKLYKEINRLAKMIVTHFTEKQQQAVKCVHVMLTDLMKHHLEKENCIPCCCKRNRDKDVYSKTLFDALDQLSVWLEGNVGPENLIDSDEEVEEEEEKSVVESSFTYSSESEEMSAESGLIYKTEMEEYDKKKLGMEDKLMAEFEEFGRARPEDLRLEERAIFEDKVIDQRIEAEEKESVISVEDLDLEGLEKLMIIETDAEGGSPEMGSVAVSEGDVIINVDEMESEPSVALAGEQELDKEQAYMLQEGLLSDIMQTIPDEAEVESTVEELQPRIEEHSPDAVCCVTIKTWTKWLVDVSHNTHHWCQWIQDVIARVRFFAAVIKGEVTMPDGRKRILHKEEWDHFTETLDRDIEAWHKYNEHVKEISENIINEFQNKRIICCPACLNSKLIIDEDSAHQVTDQLVQALNTTSYWRSWLDTIVTEAQKLKDLSFALTPSIGDEDSGSSSLGYFELVELKTASPEVTTISSSEDGSMFVLLEIEKEKEDKEPEKK